MLQQARSGSQDQGQSQSSGTDSRSSTDTSPAGTGRQVTDTASRQTKESQSHADKTAKSSGQSKSNSTETTTTSAATTDPDTSESGTRHSTAAKASDTRQPSIDTDLESTGSSNAGNTDTSALAALLQWTTSVTQPSPPASGSSAGPGVQATTTTSGATGGHSSGDLLSMSLQSNQSRSGSQAATGTNSLAAAGASSTTESGSEADTTRLSPADSPAQSPPNSDALQIAPLALAQNALSLARSGDGQHSDSGQDWDPGLATSQAANGSLSSTTAAAPQASASSSITAEVGTPAFASQLSQSVSLLVKQDMQQARIQVSPQGMGPIDIQLNVSNGVVDVSFAVQHPATVHAIQQTLPQLDSLMSSQGLQLGQAQVGHQSGQSPSRQSAYTQDENTSDTMATSIDPARSEVSTGYSPSHAMVDHFV